MRLWLFLRVWSVLWHLGLPMVLGYLWWRGRKDALYAQGWGERFGRHPKRLPGAVWIHAVSLGEMRSAVPLVRALLDRGDRVVTTHFTPAGRREAARVFADDIAAGRMAAVWVPFETSWAYAGFFRAFRPVAGLVMEIEIWPRMIFAARGAGVPLFMCNAQYPTKSMARDARFPLRHDLMRGFAGAFVKSELQAERFASVGVQNIRVTGELRFDQPIPPDLIAAGAALRTWLGGRDRRVITVASAVEGEDAVYVAAIAALLNQDRGLQRPPALIVYVPRKPERFDEVATLLAAEGFVVGRRSQLLDASLALLGDAPAINVLLGDSLGEMYAYLAMADTVIVGGGFTPKGAHNIIEPLALRKPVIVGPAIHTIEYPAVEAIAAGICWKVATPDDLRNVLLAGTAPDPTAIETFFMAHSGATQRTITALDRQLTSR